MADETVSAENTRKESFIVNIQFQQNATWQGTITWIEQKRTVHFRSGLEMIKLMDNAILSDSGDEPICWK
jgi:hypothetical protein